MLLRKRGRVREGTAGPASLRRRTRSSLFHFLLPLPLSPLTELKQSRSDRPEPLANFSGREFRRELLNARAATLFLARARFSRYAAR